MGAKEACARCDATGNEEVERGSNKTSSPAGCLIMGAKEACARCDATGNKEVERGSNKTSSPAGCLIMGAKVAFVHGAMPRETWK